MPEYAHFEYLLAKLITAFRHADGDEHRIHKHRALEEACLRYLKHSKFHGCATNDDCHEAYHHAFADALGHILTFDAPALHAARVLRKALEHHRSEWKKIRKNETSFVVKTEGTSDSGEVKLEPREAVLLFVGAGAVGLGLEDLDVELVVAVVVQDIGDRGVDAHIAADLLPVAGREGRAEHDEGDEGQT